MQYLYCGLDYSSSIVENVEKNIHPPFPDDSPWNIAKTLTWMTRKICFAYQYTSDKSWLLINLYIISKSSITLHIGQDTLQITKLYSTTTSRTWLIGAVSWRCCFGWCSGCVDSCGSSSRCWRCCRTRLWKIIYRKGMVNNNDNYEQPKVESENNIIQLINQSTNQSVS